MTLRTALIVAGDSESGKKALAELDASIEGAEKQALQLAAAFSTADIATTRLAQAQSAAKVQTDATKAAFSAGEITLEQYSHELLETKTALGLVAMEHRQAVSALRGAQSAYDGAIGRGREMVGTTDAQRIGMQQLGMQLGDMSTMWALGGRPQQIFASQAGQVIQAIQLMTGGTSKFAAFMGGPWGVAITAGAMVLVPLIGSLLDTKEAAEDVEFASYKLNDAQSILGEVIDLTTGKIKTQSEALLALARAQVVAGQIQARQDMRAARGEIDDQSRPTFRQGSTPAAGPGAAYGAGLAFDQVDSPVGDILYHFRAGRLEADQAERSLRQLQQTGKLTEKQYLDAANAVTDYALGAANLQMFQDAEKTLDGDSSAAQQFLKPGHSRTRRDTGPSTAEVQIRYEDELLGYTQQSLSAMQQLATSAGERAELEMRSLEWARRQSLAEIAANKNYTDAQKAELSAAVERQTQNQRAVIDLREQAQLEREGEQLADARYSAAREMLQVQLDLSETEADRKSLALQIYDAETEYLRAKLEALAASETATEAEKERARISLEGLNAVAGQRREGVDRANETSAERYLRELHRTPEQIGEAMDRIKMDGLEALNDGIVDAITGAKSLGDVFHDVAGQIVADLLRIAVQRAVIEPLANSLFSGGGGGPANLLAGTPYGGGGGGGAGSILSLFGSLFGGGRAAGGSIAPGKFYAVNEESTAPGLFIPLSPGRIEPPSNDNRGAAAPAMVLLQISAGELFDAKVVRISGNVAVQTVEAYAPELIGAAVNETARQFARPGM